MHSISWALLFSNRKDFLKSIIQSILEWDGTDALLIIDWIVRKNAVGWRSTNCWPNNAEGDMSSCCSGATCDDAATCSNDRASPPEPIPAVSPSPEATEPISTDPPSIRKPRFVGRGGNKNVITIKRGQGRFVGMPGGPRVAHGIPAELRAHAELNEAIASTLPGNYQFEIHKTLHKIAEHGAKKGGPQLPPGRRGFARAPPRPPA